MDKTPLKIQSKPDWLKVKISGGQKYSEISQIVSSNKLHTICKSGNCPNMAECWGTGTATFMLLGDICTRSCSFCATKTGTPLPVNHLDPLLIANSVKKMGLGHAVITSVDRDDLIDGGAAIWAETIRKIKQLNPNTTVEILIPDFGGNKADLISVLSQNPDVAAHNLETVKRLTPVVRSNASYERSLDVINTISRTGITTKSGIMVGLGETIDEVLSTMDDLVKFGCQVLTIGQYLQPTTNHLPVEKYVHPDVFAELKMEGLARGFKTVVSNPLVRSSYHAGKVLHENLDKDDKK